MSKLVCAGGRWKVEGKWAIKKQAVGNRQKAFDKYFQCFEENKL